MKLMIERRKQKKMKAKITCRNRAILLKCRKIKDVIITHCPHTQPHDVKSPPKGGLERMRRILTSKGFKRPWFFQSHLNHLQ